jgi:hypothetical protein
MGSIGPDEEGNYKDPSDGQALEFMAANTLADPNWNVEDVPAENVDTAYDPKQDDSPSNGTI